MTLDVESAKNRRASLVNQPINPRPEFSMGVQARLAVAVLLIAQPRR